MVSQNFILVGLGSIGQRHLKNLRSLFPRSHITVVRRLNKDRLPVQDNADETVSSIEQAIANRKPDAAIIASPSAFHVSDARKFLQLPCPVFLEKPLSNNSGGISGLIDLGIKNNVVCMVGYVLRFLSAMEKLKSIIGAKKYGDVICADICAGQYLPDWRPNQDYRQTVSAKAELGGGVLLELSHELDYIIDLFGLPRRVSAFFRNSGKLEIDVEDQADGILYYDNGCAVHFHLDFLQKKPTRYCTITFEQARICWNFNTGNFIIEDNHSGKTKQIMPVVTNDTYLDEFRHFFSCIDNKLKPKVGLAEGRDVLQLIDSIKESTRLQKVVELKIL